MKWRGISPRVMNRMWRNSWIINIIFRILFRAPRITLEAPQAENYWIIKVDAMERINNYSMWILVSELGEEAPAIKISHKSNLNFNENSSNSFHFSPNRICKLFAIESINSKDSPSWHSHRLNPFNSHLNCRQSPQFNWFNERVVVSESTHDDE